MVFPMVCLSWGLQRVWRAGEFLPQASRKAPSPSAGRGISAHQAGQTGWNPAGHPVEARRSRLLRWMEPTQQCLSVHAGTDVPSRLNQGSSGVQPRGAAGSSAVDFYLRLGPPEARALALQRQESYAGTVAPVSAFVGGL